MTVKIAGLTSVVIAQLKKTFPDLIILTPDSPGYAENMERWNVAAEHKAGAVIYPLNTEDVSGILAFVHVHAIDIAVCGAGHNHRGNSVDDGLIIDLRTMTAATVDPVRKTVTAQGATVWGTVYDAAWKHNLAVIGGLIPSVGVGGFTLHGGLGWLTSAHGPALDQLLEADVVLADGKILTCSETENEDLFWAIRGAGSAFGIVTRFVFQAFEQKGLVWSGMMRFDKSALKSVVDMANKVCLKENAGTASIGFAFFANSGDIEIVVLPFYNGPEEEARVYFAPLLELNSIFQFTRMMPISEATMPHGSAPGRQWRKVTAGGCFIVPLDFAFFKTLEEDLHDLATKVPEAVETIIACEAHNPYATLRKEQTSTAFPFRGRHVSIQLMPTWTKQENDEACWDFCRRIDAKINKEFVRRQNDEGMDETTKTSVGTYINYDGLHKSPKALYGVNYERLVELKKRYDPGNVFTKFVDLLSVE